MLLFRLATPSIMLKRVEPIGDDMTTAAYYPLSPEAMSAIEAIEYITDHLKQAEEYKMVRSEEKIRTYTVFQLNDSL